MDAQGVKRGIFSISTLLITLIFCLDNITVQGVSVFAPTIVKTLNPGKSTIHLQLLTVPFYAIGAFCTLLIPFSAWKTRVKGHWMLVRAPLQMIPSR